ncbi:MAG: hypothetical protein K6E97_10620 [Treponema sp.]|nr:hypothetical protein [Treponema sp.]
MIKNKIICLLILPLIFITGCAKTGKIESISEKEQFRLKYGNFPEQFSIRDLNDVGNIRMGIAMRDGFFYAVDGNAKKAVELNSYGDLLSLYYNEDSELASFIEKTQRHLDHFSWEISYPFTFTGLITVDTNKCIYAACSIPRNREEIGEEGLLYCQVVMRISRDGSSIDYIGQQGPGGSPFPYIKNIYTTQKNELVVVCNTNEGVIVYWFTDTGFLKKIIPISIKNVPVYNANDDNIESYHTIENVIPDPEGFNLFVKIDYYATAIDEDSKVQTGINYIQTLLYSLDCEEGVYGDPVSIPPYEEAVVVDYSKLNYKMPYDFLGVASNGWKYFIIKTTDGFNIEIVSSESQKILRRQFSVNHADNLYYNMNVSFDGIITALYLDKEAARVVWYRTDNLIDALLKN